MSPKPQLEIVSRTPWETLLFKTLKKGHASLSVQFQAAMDMRKADAGEIAGEEVVRNAKRNMEAEAAATLRRSPIG